MFFKCFTVLKVAFVESCSSMGTLFQKHIFRIQSLWLVFMPPRKTARPIILAGWASPVLANTFNYHCAWLLDVDKDCIRQVMTKETWNRKTRVVRRQQSSPGGNQIYCKNASGVATFLHVLHCIVEKFISYSQVDVCQLQRRVLELFIFYHPTVLTVAEHHKAFHTSSNVIF